MNPIIAITLLVALIGGAKKLYKKRKKKVFVSYYCSDDTKYKRVLNMWNKNPRIRFKMDDMSLGKSIRSTNEKYIRRRIRERISQSDCLLVIVSSSTHKRPWVSWEIEEAKSQNLPIIAVKEDRKHKSPMQLYNSQVKWIYRFNEQEITQAIEKI